MFDKYKVYPTSAFAQMPIIQSIKDETEWTVSTDNKIPVDMKHFLDTQGSVKPANVLADEYPLVKLQDMDIPMLDGINRTYHLQAQKNRIFMVDVEPKASPSMLNSAINFPANYKEISKNGGVHLLIKVPESLITDQNKYLFDGTVFKSETGDFEYIFNNHFITFTKRIVFDKPLTDFKENTQEYKQLRGLLNSIVEMDKDRKKLREAARLEKAKYKPSDTHSNLIDRIMTATVIKNAIKRQKEQEDSNNDDSRFERKIAVACAGQVEYLLGYFNTMPQSRILFKDFNDSDRIETIHRMLLEILDHRPKHDEYRYGMPWLIYQASESLTFVRSQKRIKELEKKEAKKK